MPKTSRDNYKRKVAQAYININWAATYLLELYNDFNPVHPELGAYLWGALQGLDTETEILTQFAIEAWGNTEINWQAWAGVARPRHGLEDTDSIEATTDTQQSPDTSITEDKDNAP